MIDEEKYDRLQTILSDLESVAIAFSGGVDSTLLVRAAVEFLGSENVLAVTGRSDSLPRAELEACRQLAASMGVELVELDTHEFEDPRYTQNPINRCYFCKDHLYVGLAALAEKRGIRALACGTNADDQGDYRPGIQAADTHGVRAPLAEAGFTKADVRALSAHFGLAVYNKPASPCLSSRVPYGEPVTPEKLRMIEAAEACLHELGVDECRVRHHGSLARIEVPKEWLHRLAAPENAATIDARFRELGFQYVSLDLRGFRSGSLNEVIHVNVTQSA